MACQTVACPMTSSDIQGHAPIAGLLKCKCAAANFN